MQYDVIALGELLVDFTPSGYSEQGNPLYEANPGGAPCNVLAMLTKLGKKTGFIGKVGNDLHGRFLKQALQDVGIDDAGLVIADEFDTTLAFVALMPDGERDFAFVRKAGADIALTVDEIQKTMIEHTRIFHFGSLSLTDEPVRCATKSAVQYAKEKGCLITFDPNMRELLWASMDMAKEQMLWGCKKCDVIKLAKEELFFLTEEIELEAAISVFRSKFPQVKLIFVTDGKNGSHAYWGLEHVSQPAFLSSNTVDTTGAGDSFFGCCLAFLLDNDIGTLTESLLSDMLKMANAAASLITTKKGALKVMPSEDDIAILLENAH